MNDTDYTLGFVFPGQGSQSPGMLAELGAAYPEVRACFDAASEVLDYDLWALCQEGPEEALNQTDRTQPAMLSAGVAVWQVWKQAGGPMPGLMAGHSLGEYTALVCAGSLEFTDAVRLVAERGRRMQEAVPAGTGAMAAILGLDDDQVREVCDRAAQGQVVAAVNFNSPGQVVIAGHGDAVDRAIEGARAAGARRALPLPVSVPSHCSLMEPAAEAFAASLEQTDFRTPTIPVVHNVDVATHQAAGDIRRVLKEQLHRPVRWVETVRFMQEQGVTRLVECGPGKVLAGLSKRIDKGMPALPVYDPDSLRAALDAM